MTCPKAPNGSHHWDLPHGLIVKGTCRFCGEVKDFDGSKRAERVQYVRRGYWDIAGETYEMNEALEMARESGGDHIHTYNQQGGRY